MYIYIPTLCMRATKAQKHLYNLNEAKVLLLNLVLLTEIIQYKKSMF